MVLLIDGYGLTIDDLVDVARHNRKVGLTDQAKERIVHCRKMLERKIGAGEIMYGVNTGIGELAEVVLTDEQVNQFQRYLIYNHAAGIGEPLPREVVRAAMLSRINVQAKGCSGCRLAITEMLVSMLNHGLTPVVCTKGSVGACGDLAPMSQIALAVMGEGEVFVGDDRLSADKGMERVGLKPLSLKARDGLAIINGSNITLGFGSLLLADIAKILKQSEIAAAMSTEALRGNLGHFDPRIHSLRGFVGAKISAANMNLCFEGSDLHKGTIKTRVQDAYSLRSTPQVIGAARDHWKYTRDQLEIELNGVGDNPIFLPESDEVLTGANFQGTPISMPLDVLGSALTMVCVLSERRLNRLLNPILSMGLPSFLTKGAGMFSGMMLSQYTAGMLCVEQKILAQPAYIQSIPAAADQEDFVSMGMNSALKTNQILANSYGILGIEYMAAAQALDFRDYRPGKGTSAAQKAVRQAIEHLDEDRPLFKDHNSMVELVKGGAILAQVEEVVGPLATNWVNG